MDTQMENVSSKSLDSESTKSNFSDIYTITKALITIGSVLAGIFCFLYAVALPDSGIPMALLAGVLGYIGFYAIFWVYAYPIIVAAKKNHPNTIVIGFMVIFAGWSVVLWFIALIWAYGEQTTAKAMKNNLGL